MAGRVKLTRAGIKDLGAGRAKVYAKTGIETVGDLAGLDITRVPELVSAIGKTRINRHQAAAVKQIEQTANGHEVPTGSH